MGISPLLEGYFPEGSFVWLTFCHSALTHAQRGLLLGVGDGERVVRYRTLFLPSQKIRSGLKEIEQRTLSK
jgi:hypothetical protein